jgi:acyl-CoA dehydrogenase
VTYHAPLADMSFALKYGASLLPALEEGFLGDLSMDDVEAVLSEAGRMAAEVLAPLNRTGDRWRLHQGRRRHHRAGLERSL